jgi:ubiquinone/menaquinone biosynthesis C-methylase UbiE
VELVEGYAQDLPFPDRAFDLVISTLIFHHLPD